MVRQMLLKGSLWGQWILSCNQYKALQRENSMLCTEQFLGIACHLDVGLSTRGTDSLLNDKIKAIVKNEVL